MPTCGEITYVPQAVLQMEEVLSSLLSAIDLRIQILESPECKITTLTSCFTIFWVIMYHYLFTASCCCIQDYVYSL